MVNPKSLANLKQFKKGNRAAAKENTGGGGKTITSEMRDMLNFPHPIYPHLTYRQAVAKAILDRASEGEAQQANILLDRIEGKVTQPVENTGEISIRVRYDDSDKRTNGSPAPAT